MWREKLRRWLEREGRKKTWLAQRIGVSRQTIHAWLSGKSEPKAEHIRKIISLVPEISEKDFSENFHTRFSDSERMIYIERRPNTACWGLGVLERRDRNTPARAVVGSD